MDEVHLDRAQSVLVFNFFAGIKLRGIPVYSRELEACFRRLGVKHRELRAPAWVARMPQFIQNVLFVLFEQLVAPVARRLSGCDLAIYPYNSGSFIDALAGRAVMVIHDLIPNRRDSRGLAATYIRVCQAWHALLRRPVATVSRHTMRQLNRIERFRRCEKYLWANPFYGFEAALARQPVRQKAPGASPVVLLCSGIGPNKDWRGALNLLRHLPSDQALDVRVLGFGDDVGLAQRRMTLLPAQWRERVTLLPRLSLDETVVEFLNSDLVWVHSRNEGFGRPAMEARMCGRPVVASDIGAFRQLRRFRHVHLYRDEAFDRALKAGLEDARAGNVNRSSARSFNQQLEDEVTRFLAGRPCPRRR
ncbi:glycosyltransferase [Ideonella sp. DXS29W]|uniref:Glycosyltransferase n=1 Tax=Ideonella lacteola TaxID=2984193 RepID=A0ABU9BSG2_9BURK